VDADDLLLLVLGDHVEPAVFDGIVWAVKNRPANWKLHLPPEALPERRSTYERSSRQLGCFM
jgi:hypothetical protein